MEAKRGTVPIVCEACNHSWVEEVDIDSDGVMALPFNEGWECVECAAPFEFDDFAGDVKADYQYRYFRF